MLRSPTIVLVHGASADASSWAPALGEPASVAAWKTKPSWGIVSSADHTIDPDVERFGYQCAGFREVIEIDGPHLVMCTHPAEVAAFITDAIAHLG